MGDSHNALSRRYYCNATTLWFLEGEYESEDSELSGQRINVSESDWQMLQMIFYGQPIFNHIASRICYLLMTSLGIAGSLCNMLMLSRPIYAKQYPFRAFLFAISSSDLAFNCVGLLYNYFLNFWPLTHSNQPFAAYLTLTAVAIVNCTSLFSDIAIVCLTLDRYFSLMIPHYWYSKKLPWKQKIFMVCIGACGLLCLLRIRIAASYELVHEVDSNSSEWFCSLRDSKLAKTPTFYVWTVLSEVVIPAIILSSMLYFTVRMMIKTRQLAKVAPTRTLPLQVLAADAKKGNASTMNKLSRALLPLKDGRNINLLIFLTALSSGVCQVSFIIMWIIDNYSKMTDIAVLCGDHAEIVNEFTKHVLHNFAAGFNLFCELLVRADHFYFYAIFRLNSIHVLQTLSSFVPNMIVRPFILLIMARTIVDTALVSENSIVGVPKMSCEDDQVTVTFKTKQRFSGRVFIKGMSNRSECSTAYHSNTAKFIRYQIRNGQCNMLRQRRSRSAVAWMAVTGNWFEAGLQHGIEQSVTVVVSFHGTFITKADRAFRCTCFFMEADNVVKSGMEVGSLATTDLMDIARVPSCSYRIKQDSLNGPAVSFAEVGDRVYHVWRCDSDLFGMLVHSCFVDNESGQNKFNLLDVDGCPIDHLLISELTYNNISNQAFAGSNVFKFADKPELYFQCSITLCLKSDGSCIGLIPPRCDKGRKTATEPTGMNTVERVKSKRHALNNDLSADTLLVLDITDDSTTDRRRQKRRTNYEQLNTRGLIATSQYLGRSTTANYVLCGAVASFVLIAVTVLWSFTQKIAICLSGTE